MSTPSGFADGQYVAGRTAEQLQAAAVNAPASRADDIFQPARQIKEMLETKRMMRRDIEHICDSSGYYKRERERLVAQINALQFRLEGIDSRRNNGPAMLARIDADIVALEGKLKETEAKEQVQKLFNLMVQAQTLTGQTNLPPLQP